MFSFKHIKMDCAKLFLENEKDMKDMINHCKEEIAKIKGEKLVNDFLEKLELPVSLLYIKKYEEEYETKHVINLQFDKFKKCLFTFKIQRFDHLNVCGYSFSFNNFKDYPIPSDSVINQNISNYFPSLECFLHFVKTFTRQINFPCIGTLKITDKVDENTKDIEFFTNSDPETALHLNKKYLDRIPIDDLNDYMKGIGRTKESEFLSHKRRQLSIYLNNYNLDINKVFSTPNDRWIRCDKESFKRSQIFCDFTLTIVDRLDIKFSTKMSCFVSSGDIQYDVEIDPFGKTGNSPRSPCESSDASKFFYSGGFMFERKYFPQNWNQEMIKDFIEGLLKVIYDGCFKIYGDEYSMFNFKFFSLF
jgi:hypothetical protein